MNKNSINIENINIKKKYVKYAKNKILLTLKILYIYIIFKKQNIKYNVILYQIIYEIKFNNFKDIKIDI